MRPVDESASAIKADPRVVVIGAGIAGLAAAYRVLTVMPRSQVVVLEGAHTVGGKLRLGEVAGVAVDLGAESMLARRPEAVALAKAVGLGDAIVHPVAGSAGVWSRGVMHRLPPTLMGIPADLQVAGHSGLLGRAAVARAQLEAAMPPVDLSQDTSIGRLVTRRLGRAVTERLVDPLVGGVYAGRCDELSLFAAWPQVTEALRQHGSLLPAAAATVGAGRPAAGAAPAPTFVGLQGGVGRLVSVTADAVTALRGMVRCQAMVRELRHEGSRWRLVVGSAAAPELVEADAVIVATPAASASRLLHGVAPLAAVELGHVSSASLAIVTVAMRAGAVDADLSGSGFLVPAVDGTTIKAATFSSRKWGWLPDDVVLLRCSVGRHGDEAALQRDDNDLVDAAMHDLRDATGLRAPLLDATVTRWGGALPQYAVGHLDRVARIRAAVAKVPGLEVCGATYEGVGIPAVISSANAAATRLTDHLRIGETIGQ